MNLNRITEFNTPHDEDDFDCESFTESFDTPTSRDAFDYAALSEVPPALAAFLAFQNRHWR